MMGYNGLVMLARGRRRGVMCRLNLIGLRRLSFSSFTEDLLNKGKSLLSVVVMDFNA